MIGDAMARLSVVHNDVGEAGEVGDKGVDPIIPRQLTVAHLATKIPVDALLPADSARSAGESTDHVRLLAELDVRLPPIVVHRATMRVIDGMHRLRAAMLRGDDEVEASFFDGTAADAFVLGVELNRAHGLPLTLSDRTAAAERIIRTHAQWSDRRIAQVAGLAANTVAAIRRRSTAQDVQLDRRVGRDGRIRPRDGAAGRQLAGKLMRENPDTSLREIARAAGISPATASDVRARLDRGEPPVTPRQHRVATQRNPATRTTAVPSMGCAEPTARVATVARCVMQDPSLRFSETGRALLRFLAICVVDTEEWDRMADSVPIHHRVTVAGLARACAQIWHQFGDRLVAGPPAGDAIADGNRSLGQQ